MNLYARLSATYGREELSRLIQAAQDVLGDEADTSYSVVMTAEEVMEKLNRWKAGDAGEFGDNSPNDDQINTVRKREDGMFSVRFESSEAQNWERDRAERRIPFPGCRQMIWETASRYVPPFEIDHEAVDWAIAIARGGRPCWGFEFSCRLEE